MEYSYNGILEGLKPFYSLIWKLGVGIGTFEHNYNGVHSDVVFDIRNSNGWNLNFIKCGIGDVLVIPIELWYRFSI